ncbi:MAG TPA: hypothetical protein VN253_19165, partial [Kofleriaceae bacterium]|nr:hypothetical protein [Kofleriaceae bacterium]
AVGLDRPSAPTSLCSPPSSPPLALEVVLGADLGAWRGPRRRHGDDGGARRVSERRSGQPEVDGSRGTAIERGWPPTTGAAVVRARRE